MTTPPEIARKVRQLDNDVQAIYEMLARIEATQQRQGNRLDEHGIKLDEHSVKLDAHTAVLDEHTAKLDRIIELLEAR